MECVAVGLGLGLGGGGGVVGTTVGLGFGLGADLAEVRITRGVCTARVACVGAGVAEELVALDAASACGDCAWLAAPQPATAASDNAAITDPKMGRDTPTPYDVAATGSGTPVCR